jgi:putative membrane protein
MLQPDLKKNDTIAHILIWVFSAVVFALILYTEKIKLDVDLPFNPHVFAALSAMVNSAVAVLLVVALYFVKQKKYELHRKVMMATMVLSIFFLVFYVAHHLFSGPTLYGDINHDGDVSASEIEIAGIARTIYRTMIATHIVLAGIIMPFVLYTAYRAMIGEYSVHKKIARWTFPIWLYVAVTGVLVYLMISPYYT